MAHSLFQIRDFFLNALYQRITEIRIRAPEVVTECASQRARPTKSVKAKWQLAILAADHRTYHVTRAACHYFAMGDHYGYLGRLVSGLASPCYDGTFGTPDSPEDLLILSHLTAETGGASILDNRTPVGIMDREGLAGARFEMGDTFTTCTISRIVARGITPPKLCFD